jgi:hypothetical protein
VKRPILIPTVAAALLLAAIAAPAASGGGNTVPEVSFDNDYVHGELVKVKHFEYLNVSVSCNEGAATANNFGKPLPPMKLDHRRFEGDVDRDGRQIEVSGRYNKQLTKVTGKLRVEGTVAGLTGCDSGRQRWVAHPEDRVEPED